MNCRTLRIALGAFQHEANSFSPVRADRAAFVNRGLAYGDDVLRMAVGTATEVAGALDTLAQCPQVQVLPLLAAYAGSSGPIEQATYCELREGLLARLRAAQPVNAVLLVLHGAMMADYEADASGDILYAVRQLVGPDVPVVATLDLHANVTERMVRHATALVGYHTAPHVDQFETGAAAAGMLLAALKGTCSPRMALVRLPLIIPAENARHTEGPLSEVIGYALDLERSGRILHAAVYPVQPWLDYADVGCSTVAVAHGDLVRAQAAAQALAHLLWERRHLFAPKLVPAPQAVERALLGRPRTVILCDSADATTSGGTGDSTVVLSAVRDLCPIRERVLLNVVDAEAVAQAIAAGVGNEVTLTVGAKIAPQHFSPVTVTGRVKVISDGVFRHKGPGSRGVVQRMGRAVVLQEEEVHLLIMERGVSQWDPEMYRSVGLEPKGARIVQVKSPAAFRAAYADIFDEVVIVESPGASSPKLASLPWRHLDRGIYPLNPMAEWPTQNGPEDRHAQRT